MWTTIVTRKGQVTIPEELRKRFEIKVGDQISFTTRGEEIVARPFRGSILDLRGSVKTRQQPDDFEAMRGTVRQKVAHRIASDC